MRCAVDTPSNLSPLARSCLTVAASDELQARWTLMCDMHLFGSAMLSLPRGRFLQSLSCITDSLFIFGGKDANMYESSKVTRTCTYMHTYMRM